MVLLLCLAIGVQCVARAALPPVVLLPGLAGSVFEAQLNGTAQTRWYCPKKTDRFHTIWLNPEELLPPQIDCFFDNIRLHYDPEGRVYHDADGVLLNTSVDFGGVGGLEYLDPAIRATGYFRDIIERLQVGCPHLSSSEAIILERPLKSRELPLGRQTKAPIEAPSLHKPPSRQERPRGRRIVWHSPFAPEPSAPSE